MHLWEQRFHSNTINIIIWSRSRAKKSKLLKAHTYVAKIAAQRNIQEKQLLWRANDASWSVYKI